MVKWITIGLLFLTAAVFAQNSPHGKQLQFDCSDCHAPTSWKINYSQLNFNHSVTGFELTGRHKTTECRRCHQDLVFNHASNDCRDCHAEPHQNTLGKDCAKCHTASSWTPINMVQIHNQFRFPLAGVHNIPDCQSCHSNAKNFIYSGASIECYACHQKDYQNTTNPNHVLMSLSASCDQCHTLRSTGWTAEKFVHVNISLKGPHGNLKCNQCHTTATVTQECFDCHQKDFNAAKDPNHILGKFDHNCLTCHNADTWVGARFDHSVTKFPLIGAHQAAACSQCHTSGYTGTSTNCASCHQNDYNRTTNPSHVSVGISTDCAKCHSSSGWIPSSFDHSTTGFQLAGAHSKQQCSSCHKGTTTGLSTDCFSCHQNDFNKADAHLAQNFPHECLQCHNMNSWDGATFDHSKSNFPLTGAHQTTATCSDCHKNGVFQGTPALCASCHQTNYNNAQNPVHASAGISTDCAQCHNSNAWKPSSFNHVSTGFTLTGAHINQQCSSCHRGTTTGLKTDCYSCHQSDYSKAKDHMVLGYPTSCEQCHSTSIWTGANFNHAVTNFPLTGAHATVTCLQCHSSGFKGTPTSCNSCHQNNYNSAQNPNHIAAGISNECAKCHSTTAWIPSSFIHSSTGFTLTGAHTKQQCSSCHKGTTAGIQPDCYSCHQKDYNRAENHLAQGYPKNCEQCHNTNSWDGATFNHSATSFPLTGAHTTTSCMECHSGGFKGTANVCFSCHQNNFNNTTNPKHSVLSMQNTCETCHTTNPGWKPAQFPNHNNYYVLSGAHAAKANDCYSCHKGNYNNTPNTCYGCHQNDFTNTTNPSHQSLGFSQDCTSCHTNTAWQPATYKNHDAQFFPIYSGSHRGRWNTCADCHTVQTNYKVFECINCHEHAQSSMDSKHRSVKNYVYKSTECYRCHPTGRGGFMQSLPGI